MSYLKHVLKVLLLFINSIVLAQITGTVKYSKSIIDQEVPLVCSSELTFDGKRTLYISNVGTYPGKYVTYNGKQSQIYLDEKGDQVLKDITNKKLLLRVNSISSAYVSEERLPVFEWKLKNESKKILGFKCFKAFTSFRGREYTAWYAPDIAISEGPWKFYGLPGLILEIYDVKEQVFFKAIQIEIPSNVHPIKGLDTKKGDKHVSLENFRRADQIEIEHWTNVSKADSEGIDNFEVEWQPITRIELNFKDDQKKN